MTTYEDLERAFAITIGAYRKGVYSDCQRDALFAHSIFYPTDGQAVASDEVRDFPFNQFPFEQFWIVTNFKGLAISALVRPHPVGRAGNGIINFHWFWSVIPGQRHRTTQAELDRVADVLIFRALNALHNNMTAEVESDVHSSINRGRAKTVGKPSYVPPLPVSSTSRVSAVSLLATRVVPTPALPRTTGAVTGGSTSAPASGCGSTTAKSTADRPWLETT